jgi:hypothetical protein
MSIEEYFPRIFNCKSGLIIAFILLIISLFLMDLFKKSFNFHLIVSNSNCHDLLCKTTISIDYCAKPY